MEMGKPSMPETCQWANPVKLISAENTQNAAWSKVAQNWLICPELVKSQKDIFIINSLPFITKNVKVQL